MVFFVMDHSSQFPQFTACVELCYAQSLGMLFKSKGNGTSFTTYPRTQNVHVFDFEKVPEEMYGGEDTTNGRTLKLELQFNKDADVKMVNDAGADVMGADGQALVMKRGMVPSESVVFIFQHFTTIINVSSKGLLLLNSTLCGLFMTRLWASSEVVLMATHLRVCEFC